MKFDMLDLVIVVITCFGVILVWDGYIETDKITAIHATCNSLGGVVVSGSTTCIDESAVIKVER